MPRKPSCECGSCTTCKKRAGQAAWVASKSPEERRRISARKGGDRRLKRANERAYVAAHPLYHRWKEMRQRCRNPKHWKYPAYGGRPTAECPNGIYVAAEWDDFSRFEADLMALPHALETGYSMDRIHNDGPYAPGNVRWSTAAQQRQNQYRQPWPFGVLWSQKIDGQAEAEYHDALEQIWAEAIRLGWDEERAWEAVHARIWPSP